MARPLRKLWHERGRVRRRHRTWMFSMCMATLGWATWWTALVWLHAAPASAPDLRVVAWIASAFAALGFAAVVFGMRARLAWLLFLFVPAFANASILLVPAVLRSLRVVETTHAPDQG